MDRVNMYARVHESLLREQLCDFSLTTLESRLSFAIARPCFLALVTFS